jgi:HSP20 family molecular chaperone IbpA
VITIPRQVRFSKKRFSDGVLEITLEKNGREKNGQEKNGQEKNKS